MSPLTPKKTNIGETLHKRRKVSRTDAASFKRPGDILTCNEVDVDALLSDGEST